MPVAYVPNNRRLLPACALSEYLSQGSLYEERPSDSRRSAVMSENVTRLEYGVNVPGSDKHLHMHYIQCY